MTTRCAPTSSPGWVTAAAPTPFVEAALAEVEDWITYRQTGGAAGALPGHIIGLEPLPHP